MENQGFLGSGWSFPPKFDKYSKSVIMDNGEVDIENSIRIILGTYPGERLMNPNFGCAVKRMNFENIDKGNVTRIQEIVGNALELGHQMRFWGDQDDVSTELQEFRRQSADSAADQLERVIRELARENQNLKKKMGST
jgi:hypothetical protein